MKAPRFYMPKKNKKASVTKVFRQTMADAPRCLVKHTRSQLHKLYLGVLSKKKK